MKNIAILGSTGSIGTQTLEIVRENPDLRVKGLAAGRNAVLMEKQIREFSPETAVMWNEEAAKELDDVRSEKLKQVAKEADDMLGAARERAQKEHDRIINGVSDDIKEIVGEAAEKVVMTSSVNDAYEQFLSAAESGVKSAHAGRKKTVTSMSKTDKKGGARKKK